MRIGVSGLMVLICCTLITGQGTLDTKRWSIEDGLSNRNIRLTFRDGRDILWIVSSVIESYDGYNFQTYYSHQNLGPNSMSNVVSAAPASDSTLIILDYNQLVLFNTYDKASVPLSFPEGLTTDYELHSIRYNPKTGDYIITSKKGGGNYIHLVNKSWKVVHTYKPPDANVNARFAHIFTFGEAENLWILEEANGKLINLNRLQTDTFHVNFPLFQDGELHKLIHYHNEGIFALSTSGVITKFIEASSSFKHWVNLGSQYGVPKNLNFDRNNNLQLLYPDEWVNIDLKRKTLKKYYHDLLPDPSLRVLKMVTDRENITWVSSELGFLRVNPSPKPFLSGVFASKGNKNIQFREIIKTNDSSKFLARINDGSRQLISIHFKKDQSIDTAYLFRNINPTGELHAFGEKILHVPSSSKKATVYDPKAMSISTISLPVKTSSNYHTQSVLKDDTLHYLNGDQKIVKLDMKSGDFSELRIDQEQWLRSGECKTLIYVPDRYYIAGTVQGGIYFIDPDSGKVIHHYSLRTKPSLSSDHVNTILVDSNEVIWVGLMNGYVNKIDLANDSIIAYHQAHGLSNHNIVSMEEDRYGHLWIASYDGLCKFNKKQETAICYYTSDGLPNNEFNYLASTSLAGNTLLFGSFNGMTKFNPSVLIQDEYIPKPEIRNIEKYNQKLGKTTQEIYPISEELVIKLKPYESSLKIDFRVPSYVNNVPFAFLVQIPQLEEDWVDLGSDPFVRYPGLPPGKYDLFVKAYLPNGLVSEEAAVFTVEVLQYFYKTWWFFLLVTLFGIGVVYYLYQIRLKLIKREADTRSRIASDLHDEIGSAMTRISLQLQMLESKVKKEEQQKLEKINTVVDSSISKMRDMVWSIDKSSDKWKNIEEYMLDYAMDTLAAKGIQFSFEAQGIAPQKNIDPLTKRNLYLIFKEVINNIAKHSNGDLANCVIRNVRGSFRMTISDNGSLEKPIKEGNGLKNMKMRAERMEGNCGYGQSEANGFEVNVKLPYQI